MSHLVTQYQALLRNGHVDVVSFLASNPDSSWEMQLDVVLLDQSNRWLAGTPATVEEYLAGLPHLAKIPQAVIALAIAEYSARHKADSKPNLKEYTERFPEFAEQIRAKVSEINSASLAHSSLKTQKFSPDFEQDVLLCNRYRLIRLLGEGSFGKVYLALDLELKRQVAIKVPNPERFMLPQDTEMYLEEAQTVASLEHPNIVAVYDTGRTPEGAVFIVSRYIEGETLESRMHSPISFEEAAKILKIVAEALQYAHERRLIHRDIKPANILLEKSTNTPFLTDFGLAIRDDDYAKQLGLAGTVAFMSPEQARGEGHRLDGRSDIFALGVILYEMLTGERPFQGSTQNEIIHKIISLEPRPPRLMRSEVPAELERICLKALSKQLSTRYSQAAALADDLVAWQLPATSPVEANTKIQIVPRGLRSFDASSASFFLDLLPGLRNRDGLPESIAFWKKRIEETDPDQTFSVGLIYGPSGCGKSSLVKAGLIPSLSNDVACIYVEATAEVTETRILLGLKKQLPELLDGHDLAETLAALRCGQAKKVVIIIDQFEQWLHAHRAEWDSELVRALRQCDGGRVQAIVMVRDDFSVAVARLMNKLDIPMVQGDNFALVDLFDTDHAEKVLRKFGQAYGKLPHNLANISTQETNFVHEVIEELSEDGKVVPIRLSLLGEMIKGKVWEPTTLGKIGGIQGIGVSFLEEAFCSPQASPGHRLHAIAARGVLKALLPDLGTDIRGQMRSQAELLEASGYGSRPADFKDLLRILDGELRLITPTDPDGHGSQSGTDCASVQFFQLTHDYLVPSLRDWLTSKQRETRKGRAELKLAERAIAWESVRETKQLPTMFEWLSIRTLTESRQWSETQEAMMKKAGLLFGIRICLGSAMALALCAIGLALQSRIAEQHNTTQVQGWVQTLINAEPDQLVDVIEKLDSNSRLSQPELLKFASSSPATQQDARAQLHSRLALVSRDATFVPALLEEALTNDIRYVGTIREQLGPYREQVTTKLLEVLNDDSEKRGQADRRFRAALILAGWLPSEDATAWTVKNVSFIAKQLVASNTERQSRLRGYLRPIEQMLLPDLERIYLDRSVSETLQVSAANAIFDFASTDASKLAELLAVATPEQYAILFPALAEAKDDEWRNVLLKLVGTAPSAKLSPSERIVLGQTRAGAAITLLRQGEREAIFAALRFSTDPEALTQFIALCSGRGVEPSDLLECIEKVHKSRQLLQGAARKMEDRVLYGLLLAVGSYPLDNIPDDEHEVWKDRLVQWYSSDPSSAVHGAAGWLLRRWNFGNEARQIDQTPIAYDPSGEREWFTLKVEVARGSELNEPTRSPLYFTFVVFLPGSYIVGSPDSEYSRNSINEQSHSVELKRTIAVCDRELTWRQFNGIDGGVFFESAKAFAGLEILETEPAFGKDWYYPITYCRWLTSRANFDRSEQCYDALPASKTDPTGRPKAINVFVDRPGFRLPTETEWEIACRGSTETAFSFGNDSKQLGEYGWFKGSSSYQWHPVAERRPNCRGLFDLHGNIQEWCHDMFVTYYPGVNTNGEEVSGSSNPLIRVCRGGHWDSSPTECRSSNRAGFAPTWFNQQIGCRLVMTLPDSDAP